MPSPAPRSPTSPASGSTEAMIAEDARGGALAAAATTPTSSSSTGSVDVMALEDGEVNRAYASVELGRGRARREGRPDRLRLHRGRSRADALEACAAHGRGHRRRPVARRRRSRSTSARRCPQRYPLKRALGGGPARGEAPAPRRASTSRRFAADPRIKKVSTSASRRVTARCSSPTRTGRLVEDVQPMTLLWLSCMAEQDGRREKNGYNVAGRAGLRVLLGRAPRPRRAARRWPARPILFEAVHAAGGRDARRAGGRLVAASCCTRPSATAWRPTSTARTSPSTPTRSASRSPSRS